MSQPYKDIESNSYQEFESLLQLHHQKSIKAIPWWISSQDHSVQATHSWLYGSIRNLSTRSIICLPIYPSLKLHYIFVPTLPEKKLVP